MIAIVLLNVLVVLATVLIHYECLVWLNVLLPRLKVGPRFRIVFGICGALVAHAVEVWVFAAAYFLVLKRTNWGTLEGNCEGNLLDCVYFSFTTYTTLGFGDIIPVGSVRYLTGIEALTGLVLITWTASFLFLEMQRHWMAGKQKA